LKHCAMNEKNDEARMTNDEASPNAQMTGDRVPPSFSCVELSLIRSPA
jgi:hypothetical protein